LQNTSGMNNVAVGRMALWSTSTGSSNVAVGEEAFSINTTGNQNTAIGANCGMIANNLNNATAIGFGAFVNASGKIRLGNAAVGVIEGQVPYSFPSDGRFKTNVTEDVKGLEFIMKLRPIIYNFDTRKFDAYNNYGILQASNKDYEAASAVRQSGFIAQEVEKAANESGYDFNGVVVPKTRKETYSLAYSQFVVPLVKAMQEQQQMLNDKETRLQKIENMLTEKNKEQETLKQQVELLVKEVQSLKANRQ